MQDFTLNKKRPRIEFTEKDFPAWEKPQPVEEKEIIKTESENSSPQLVKTQQIEEQDKMGSERAYTNGIVEEKDKKREHIEEKSTKSTGLFERMKVDKEQKCLHINGITITESDLLKLLTTKQEMKNEIIRNKKDTVMQYKANCYKKNLPETMHEQCDIGYKKDRSEQKNINDVHDDSYVESNIMVKISTNNSNAISRKEYRDGENSCDDDNNNNNNNNNDAVNREILKKKKQKTDKEQEEEEEEEEDDDEYSTENKLIEVNNGLRYIIDNRIYAELDIPQSNNINALFMDFYHLIMAYTYFKQEKYKLKATFEIYFRKCPFEGTYAILAGTDEVMKYINSFRFTKSQLNFIKKRMNNYEDIDSFIEYLSTVSGKDVAICSMDEGSIIFANEPVMIVEGNLLVCQLIESAIINLLNYPILIATNSVRYKISINYKTLAEFGCRRAQGTDGALSGSKYSVFGCDFTSNVYASYLYNIPLLGTMSHSFILSFQSNDILNSQLLNGHDFLKIVEKNKKKIHDLYNCEYRKDNELTAFVAFAQINPEYFICLIDTYDCLRSGIFNFLIVALSLYEINYSPIGIRIDSGDLRYLSNECQLLFEDVSKKCNVPFYDLKICVSNDINEKVIKYLNERNHNIGVFAIGTNLVTCQSQPSLGLIYKLVQIQDRPCFKMTNENDKANLPYKKNVYRLYTSDNYASIDYVQLFDDPPPVENEKLFCINVLDESKKCFIIPKKVEKKLLLRWNYGKLMSTIKSLKQTKKYTWNEIKKFRNEHFRSTLPIPFKVSFSEHYHQLYKKLLLQNSFIATLT